MEHLVATINKNNKDRVKLKRALYEIPMEELILCAINEYNSQPNSMTCPYCKEKCRVTVKPFFEQNIDFSGKTIVIAIENYPRNLCRTCGGEYENLEVESLLEEILIDQLTECVQNNTAFPEKVDFFDLLKLDI
ncbi:hypothetical protein ACQKM9_17435 [Viridibacillus sp. NPDC093762]|uniref:hypothetical protein n=1 Tax=Viridibacillus sp. NPDC093762 TaxID=3390720 RepID=UPI003CFC00C4